MIARWLRPSFIYSLYEHGQNNYNRITVDNLPGNQRKHLHTTTATEAALLEMLRLYAADILMSYEWVQSTDCKSVLDICRLQLFSHFLSKNKQKRAKTSQDAAAWLTLLRQRGSPSGSVSLPPYIAGSSSASMWFNSTSCQLAVKAAKP